MHKTSLEINAYVLGAGAFGVFFRWMQTQMAFDDLGLPEKSIFNFLVPVVIIAAAVVFSRFVDNFRNHRYYMPEDFFEAFRNEGRIFTAIRWAIGALMSIGALFLFATCETEKHMVILRILAVLGFLSGIAFPLLLSAANDEDYSRGRLCIYSVLPVAMFAMWLVCSYMENAINSVVWAYAIEIVTICFTMLAFFRMAGFHFESEKPWRAMFFDMFAAFLCIMSLADERNMGMQMMFLSAALMLVMYNWIMIMNLKRKVADPRKVPNDGFERL